MNLILNVVTRLEFDWLKETMQMYQNNIDNNITWFYMSLGIVLAVLILGLIYLVKTSVSIGIEKGIERTRQKTELLIKESQQFHFAKGSSNIIDNKIHISGLSDFSKENIVSVTVITKHGQILENNNIIINDEGFLTINTHGIKEFLYVHWTIVWIPTKLFEPHVDDKILV
ncbi:hypothetical protein [Sporosarcina sp. FA9]|uniref:hypothetical protein n=1 Tax=Sporosarcina sp. FA9 TaxID=3413030 RepID=UPI003F6571B1